MHCSIYIKRKFLILSSLTLLKAAISWFCKKRKPGRDFHCACRAFIGPGALFLSEGQPSMTPIRLIAGEIQWCIPFYPGSHVFMSSCPSTLEYLIFFQLETQRRTLVSPQDQNFRKYVMHDQNFGSFW